MQSDFLLRGGVLQKTSNMQNIEQSDTGEGPTCTTQSFKATPAVPVSQNLSASLKAALQHKSDMNYSINIQ